MIVSYPYMLLLGSCGQRASARVSTANISLSLISSCVMLAHIARGPAVKFNPAQLPWVKQADGSAAQRVSAAAVQSEIGYSDSEQDLHTANNRSQADNFRKTKKGALVDATQDGYMAEQHEP